jgi:hypothetical protein
MARTPTVPSKPTTPAGKAAAIPTVIFVAKDGAGTDLLDVSILLDGDPLVALLDVRAVSLDAGPHTLRFEARSGAVEERPIVLLEGEKNRREGVVLVATVETRPRRRTTQRALATASLGAGIVGLGIGAALGALAVAAKNGELSARPPRSRFMIFRVNSTAGEAQEVERLDLGERDLGYARACGLIAQAAATLYGDAEFGALVASGPNPRSYVTRKRGYSASVLQDFLKSPLTAGLVAHDGYVALDEMDILFTVFVGDVAHAMNVARLSLNGERHLLVVGHGVRDGRLLVRASLTTSADRHARSTALDPRRGATVPGVRLCAGAKPGGMLVVTQPAGFAPMAAALGAMAVPGMDLGVE